MNVLRKLYAWFEYPHRFAAVRDVLRRPGCVILDVGCGNHSPSLTRRYFPHCRYEGLDRGRWNRDEADDAAMDRFFAVDLDGPDALAEVPNAYYDVIFCSHVLEHVARPGEVFSRLLTKLRPSGVIYVEVPSPRSVRFPPARHGWLGIKGCLNFWDDPTHRSLVRVEELVERARTQGLLIRRYGKRRLWRRILLLPLYMLAGIVLRGYVPASVVWDAVGFADYLVAERPAVSPAVPAPHFDGSAKCRARTSSGPSVPRPHAC